MRNMAGLRILIAALVIVGMAQGAQAGDWPMFLQMGVATQSQPPNVTTNLATNITSNSALLKGTGNPNGLPTEVVFVLGDGRGKQETSPIQNIGSGFSPVEVRYTWNGLKPGTTYYYYIRAINNAGSKYGNTVKFTTLLPETLSSSIKFVPYQVFTATGKIPEQTDGKYLLTEIGDEKYVVIGGKFGTNIEKFTILIVEQKDKDEKSIVIGETWDVGGGWSIILNSIDVKTKQAWLTLKYRGLKLDDKVVSQGEVYTFLEQRIADEFDVPTFVTYIDYIGTNDLKFKYTWAISRNVKIIQNKGYLAVSGSKSIVIFNLTGLYNIEKTIQIDQCSRCESITWDGSYFWIASFDMAKIYKVDFNGKVVARLDAPEGTKPSGLAWDGNYLWMSSYINNGGVYKINPQDGTVIKKYVPIIFQNQGYGGLAYDSDKKFLWLADALGSGIYKLEINEQDLKLISQVPSPDKYLSGLAWDGNSIYVYGNQAYKIFKLESDADGKIVFSISPKPEFGQNAGLVYIKEIPTSIPTSVSVNKIGATSIQTPLSTPVPRQDSTNWGLIGGILAIIAIGIVVLSLRRRERAPRPAPAQSSKVGSDITTDQPDIVHKTPFPQYLPKADKLLVLREYEFFNGFIRVKLSVNNKNEHTITDVALDLDIDDHILRLDHHEPDYVIRKGKIRLENISPNSDKTISMYLEPLTCSKEGMDINCRVDYKNAYGKPDSVRMEVLKIPVVCPIFHTEQDINIGRLKELIASLPAHGSKVFSMYRGIAIEGVLALCREIIQMHDVRHVRTFKTADGKTFETWYYGKTKIKKIDLVIKASVSKETESIELFVAAPDQEALTGILAELVRNLTKKGESMGKLAPQINLIIKDSIIQRSNLLDSCDFSGICGANVVIEDSIVQRANIGSK